jgi:ABC-type hemin transport system substrate-binding protein
MRQAMMRAVTGLLLAATAALAAPPARIVSTAPSFTETVFALGAGDRVVAVSTYCHYPAAVEKLPRVGDYLNPNVEAIARLRPDLVLVHAEQKQILAQLNGLGLRTLALRNTSLEETLGSVREIGAAIGLAEKGSALERDLRGRLAAIGKRHAGKTPRSVGRDDRGGAWVFSQRSDPGRRWAQRAGGFAGDVSEDFAGGCVAIGAGRHCGYGRHGGDDGRDGGA